MARARAASSNTSVESLPVRKRYATEYPGCPHRGTKADVPGQLIRAAWPLGTTSRQVTDQEGVRSLSMSSYTGGAARHCRGAPAHEKRLALWQRPAWLP